MNPQAGPHIRRIDKRQAPANSESLIRDAHQVLAACGVARSPSWVSRTVHRYMRVAEHKGFPFGPYLLNQVQLNLEQRLCLMHDPELASFLSYADPTGEMAVRNVERRKGGEFG